MRHVFKAKVLGYPDRYEGVWFDADSFTKEEAEAQFVPYQGYTHDGYPYTGYEYDGVRYHHYAYIGLFEDDQMPMDDADILAWMRKKIEENGKV